jgi:hypothetical protein
VENSTVAAAILRLVQESSSLSLCAKIAPARSFRRGSFSKNAYSAESGSGTYAPICLTAQATLPRLARCDRGFHSAGTFDRSSALGLSKDRQPSYALNGGGYSSTRV